MCGSSHLSNLLGKPVLRSEDPTVSRFLKATQVSALKILHLTVLRNPTTLSRLEKLVTLPIKQEAFRGRWGSLKFAFQRKLAEEPFDELGWRGDTGR